MITSLIKRTKGVIFTLILMVIPYTIHAKQKIVSPVDSYAAELLEGRDLEDENDLVRGDLVDSKEMALQLAELYVKKFYSERSANSQKPYFIADNKTEWIVTGQLRRSSEGILIMGGTFLIVISKKDGKVIVLTHDR